MMKVLSSTPLLGLASVAFCLLGSGCSPEVAVAKPEPPKVTVRHPEIREVVDYKEFNGTTQASATVEIRSRVRGHIDKVAFVDGQDVKEGSLLFELDPRPFELEITAAKEQFHLAEAQLAAAQQDEKRQINLKAQDAARDTDVDKAIAMRKSWDAKIEIAKEDIRRRELDLEYARITSPIAGKTGRALLTKGNLVNAGGSDPLMTTVVAIDPIYVYFNVDERSLLEFRDHRRSQSKSSLPTVQEARIPFEFGLETESAYPNKGSLDFAENKIRSTTGTIEIRGSAPNADGRYVPGSRVRVRVAVSDPYQGTVIPDSAILSDQDRKYVLALNPENIVIRRDVLLGKLLEDGMRVVRAPTGGGDPLTPQDRIVVIGLQRARVNYPVQPMDEQGAAEK